MPTKRSRTAALFLSAALAAALPGCGGPEGSGTIDVDAARRTMLAQGAKYHVKPDGVKRPAGRSVASRRR